MIFIEIRKKTGEILAYALFWLMLSVALFLLILSLIFAFGGDTPNLFGRYIYLIKSDAFALVESPSAVIAGKAPYDELLTGNIVIFRREDGAAGLGEITEIVKSDGVYYFALSDETRMTVNVVQTQIIAKAAQYSKLLGLLFGFAVSAPGVAVIAVLPCLCLITAETLKTMGRKKEEAIVPVNKQDETPTYVSPEKKRAVIRAYMPPEKVESPLYQPPPKTKQPTKPPDSVPLSMERLDKAIAAVKAEKGKVSETPDYTKYTQALTQTLPVKRKQPTAYSQEDEPVRKRPVSNAAELNLMKRDIINKRERKDKNDET